MRTSLNSLDDFMMQPAQPRPGLASSSRGLGPQRLENPFADNNNFEEAISEIAANQALTNHYLESSLRAGRSGLQALEEALEGDGSGLTPFDPASHPWDIRTWMADRDRLEAGISGDPPVPQVAVPVTRCLYVPPATMHIMHSKSQVLSQHRLESLRSLVIARV